MREESASALDRLIDTVKSIQSELDGLSNITDMTSLGRLEERIRNECQVIEAIPGYLGQEVFKRIQTRRTEIRREQINQIRNLTEKKDGTRSSGNPGNGDRTDESSRTKLEGDKQASKPAGQSRRKK